MEQNRLEEKKARGYFMLVDFLEKGRQVAVDGCRIKSFDRANDPGVDLCDGADDEKKRHERQDPAQMMKLKESAEGFH